MSSASFIFVPQQPVSALMPGPPQILQTSLTLVPPHVPSQSTVEPLPHVPSTQGLQTCVPGLHVPDPVCAVVTDCVTVPQSAVQSEPLTAGPRTQSALTTQSLSGPQFLPVQFSPQLSPLHSQAQLSPMHSAPQ